MQLNMGIDLTLWRAHINYWRKDVKAPVSIICVCVAVGVGLSAVRLHSLYFLLIRSGDVETNPGPIQGEF